MKSTKIIYWTTTVLFAAFMIFSAIPDILVIDETKKFMEHLGYPDYFTQFIGIAKVLGSIAILIPAFKKIKEWAYAGLFFDLIGAVYSITMVEGVNASMIIFMVVIFAVAITSYVYNEKYYSGKE